MAYLEQRLDALPAGASEIVIGPYCAIQVRRDERGAYAVVDDPGSTFHGLDAYGSKPSLALALLRYKLAGFIDEDPK